MFDLLKNNGLSDFYINFWQKFQISSLLSTFLNLFTAAEASPPPVASIPIILDLDSDGVETKSINEGAYFDHDSNGFAEKTGWVNTDDGLLAWDKNGDGIINDGKELFNDPNGFPGATNGFQVLSALDGNKDGKIDQDDNIWSQLKIWRDYNGDGKSSPDELYNLSDFGIASINTTYNSSTFIDSKGNEHRWVGNFTWLDGSVGTAIDVTFKVDKAYTIANEWLKVPQDFSLFPDLQGFGNVYDLCQAMMRDESGQLKGLIEQFMIATEINTRNSLMEQILFKWTGAEEIAPASRGPNIDARRLGVLEKFFGDTFVGIGRANPNVNSATLLNQSYKGIFEMFYSGLMIQTHLKDIYGDIYYRWDENSQSIKGDLSVVINNLRNRITTNPSEGKILLSEFVRTLKGFKSEAVMDYLEFRNTFFTQSEELGWIIDSTGKNIITGSSNNDSIIGTNSDDGICGGRGDDSIYGSIGNDVLYGNEGSDYLHGNDGDDLIAGGLGSDSLYGGSGNDVLDGGVGNDYLEGGLGNDVYVFGCGMGRIRFMSMILPREILIH